MKTREQLEAEIAEVLRARKWQEQVAREGDARRARLARYVSAPSPEKLYEEYQSDLAAGVHHGERRGRARDFRRHATKRWAGTEVQALLFARPQWTASTARAWAREHGYHSAKVHETDNYVRLRQFDPVPGTQKRTITFGRGIKAIVEQVKK